MKKHVVSFLSFFMGFTIFSSTLAAETHFDPIPPSSSICSINFVDNLEQPGRLFLKELSNAQTKTSPTPIRSKTFQSLETLIEVFEADSHLTKMIVQLDDASSDRSCMLKSYLSEFYPQVTVRAVYSKQKKQFVYLVNIQHLSTQNDEDAFIRVGNLSINRPGFYGSSGGYSGQGFGNDSSWRSGNSNSYQTERRIIIIGQRIDREPNSIYCGTGECRDFLDQRKYSYYGHQDSAGRGRGGFGGKKNTKKRCFAKGTPIHTLDGLKAIEAIQVGDLVASKNKTTGILEYKPVVQLFKNTNKTLLQVHLFDHQGQSETLRVTPEHPFWVVNKGWVSASQLHIDDAIASISKHNLIVQSIETLAGKHDTYNFEVADFHTYFVGKQGAWVHNTGCAINPKSVKQFGHTFTKHGAGAKITKKLMDRARTTSKSQGQFLNNNAAAIFLNQYKNISMPKIVNLPSGLGQVISPSGIISKANRVQIVPKKGGGIKTAYPIP
jgi:hypothetical protein